MGWGQNESGQRLETGQQNNPLTKAFIDQVRDVDGVEEVKVKHL